MMRMEVVIDKKAASCSWYKSKYFTQYIRDKEFRVKLHLHDTLESLHDRNNINS